ncbi:MAG: MBL fold metallo-hydrolase [Cyanobacteria bacterium P01_A01_bin.114]
MASSPPSKIAKAPRQVLETIYAFPPNRDTLGGTAYLLLEKHSAGAPANLLIDCPAWDADLLNFIETQGGVRWLLLTHRNGSSRVKDFQTRFGCTVVVQEQEAYLLPQVPTTPFQQTFRFSPTTHALWTPGYSPGSACLYTQAHGGVLFSGRHLLPNREGHPAPLRFSKTFHWPRQLRSVQRLQDEFTPETLRYLCPGANTGFLRGQRVIEDAYAQLATIDLEACRQTPAML